MLQEIVTGVLVVGVIAFVALGLTLGCLALLIEIREKWKQL